MDNIILVRKYITQHYDVLIGNKVSIIEKFNGTTISLSRFIFEVEQIFGGDCDAIINGWYFDRVKQKTSDIQEYLTQYRIVLGSVNWLILDSNDNEFQISDMLNHFKGIYSDMFIRSTHDEWYIRKLDKYITEKLRFS